MVRLNFLVEGQSEEAFVKHILSPHLAVRSVVCSVRMVTTSQGKGRAGRGGMTKYAKVHSDLMKWMKKDRGDEARFTTMFDWYRLPGDFPGMEISSTSGITRIPGVSPTTARVHQVEQAMRDDVGDWRLIPYFQVHEFEALILSDATQLLKMFPDRQEAVQALAALAAQEGGPESIDLDNPPSKRILAAIPAYDKVAAATQVTQAIGLETMRRQCPHFDSWVTRLERLPDSAPPTLAPRPEDTATGP